ncbi:MAG: Kinesin [Phylliscum demangeonii]|nr:MAG: Kinesin [Phylliscum demangeonii]
MRPDLKKSMAFASSASAPSLRSRESSVVPVVGGSRAATGGGGGGGGNVRVVVRVRAFLPREVARGAQCLVRMNARTQATTLLVPAADDPYHAHSSNSSSSTRKVAEEKHFTFDNSFWSHDARDGHYAHQDDIYNSLGEPFLDHNFEGYHTCIFAYGQTGSGKSYTMMGTGAQPGLMPRTCEDLFQRIEANPSPHVSYSVRVSYFEVYNEHVRDLLVPRTQPAYYLKIRESPTDGPYVKDLTDAPVKSLAEIMRYMTMGDASRTIASTKMNDSSSRSHAVFTIMLKQIHHDLDTDETTERMARIRLVDLAGSERAKATEATGARLREGSNINRSLTTLGRVMAALASDVDGGPSSGPPTRKKTTTRPPVPYRDSILTWLLKDSLGGNSKTAMIACIAPADYDETLSTLRYADQAKRIRTRAIVNQDQVSGAERDAQIAAMQDTIRALQLSVSQQQLVTRRENDAQSQQLDDYQEKVEQMQHLMEETRQVSDCKIRSLLTQNEALRRHLKLALDALKHPIPIPIPIPAVVVPPLSERERESKREHEHDKENQVIADDDNNNNNIPSSKATTGPPPVLRATPSTHSCLAAAPDDDNDNDNDDNDSNRDGDDPVPVPVPDPSSAPPHAFDTHQHMQHLLADLSLFRRKVADDHHRFTRPALAEISVN